MSVDAAALDLLRAIADEVPRYRGRLWSFVRSIDAADHAGPEELRRLARELAALVAPEAEEVVQRAHEALAWACCGDDWAEREIAGRFLSGVRRLRVLAALRRHPRAQKLQALCRAVERGRFTAAQWERATKLAAEVA